MQKALKPPPPVPPRPSKSLIKEALAKTKDMRRGPSRIAPPPPQNGVAKSASAYTVNVGLKPVPLERSASEEANHGSRPIVYQSPNSRGVANGKVTILKEENHTEADLNGKNVENSGRCADFLEDSRSRSSTMEKKTISTGKSSNCSSASSSNSNSLDKKWDKMLNDRNHVNTLIDEMFASVLEVSDTCDEKKSKEDNNRVIINNKGSDEEDDKPVPTTVIVITDQREEKTNAEHHKKVQFSDKMNHELLIEELQHMKEDQHKILKRQRKPSKDIYGKDIGVGDVLVNGCHMVESDEELVKMNTCHITIEDSGSDSEVWIDYDRISKMSHLHGLPPLPKSLSNFGIGGGRPPPSPARSQRRPEPAKAAPSLDTMDTQLAILRREMYSLRQQDLSLLSQLWSLNESIQDFRAILQEQDAGREGGVSPPPAPSSADDDDDEYYATAGGGYGGGQQAAAAGGGRRTSASSAASGSVG